jgi:hypothetical protein
LVEAAALAAGAAMLASEAVNLPPAASARGRKVSGTDQHGDLVGV